MSDELRKKAVRALTTYTRNGTLTWRLATQDGPGQGPTARRLNGKWRENQLTIDEGPNHMGLLIEAIIEPKIKVLMRVNEHPELLELRNSAVEEIKGRVERQREIITELGGIVQDKQPEAEQMDSLTLALATATAERRIQWEERGIPPSPKAITPTAVFRLMKHAATGHTDLLTLHNGRVLGYASSEDAACTEAISQLITAIAERDRENDEETPSQRPLNPWTPEERVLITLIHG